MKQQRANLAKLKGVWIMLKIMTKEEKDETVMQIMALVSKLANESVPLSDETQKAKMLRNH